MGTHTPETTQRIHQGNESGMLAPSRSGGGISMSPNRPGTPDIEGMQEAADNSEQVSQLMGLQEGVNNSPQVDETRQLQARVDQGSRPAPIQMTGGGGSEGGTVDTTVPTTVPVTGEGDLEGPEPMETDQEGFTGPEIDAMEVDEEVDEGRLFPEDLFDDSGTEDGMGAPDPMVEEAPEPEPGLSAEDCVADFKNKVLTHMQGVTSVNTKSTNDRVGVRDLVDEAWGHALRLNNFHPKKARRTMASWNRKAIRALRKDLGITKDFKISRRSSNGDKLAWNKVEGLKTDLFAKLNDLASRGSAKSGWERKLLDEDTNLHRTLAEHGAPNSRTPTRYGYANNGAQGPHTIARCLGVSIRDERITAIYEKYQSSEEKDGEGMVREVGSLFSPYVNNLSPQLNQHILFEWGKSSGRQDPSQGYAQPTNVWQGAQKSVGSPNLDSEGHKAMVDKVKPGNVGGRAQWEADHGEGYHMGLHYLEAFEYYRQCFFQARDNNQLSTERRLHLVVSFGQVLADLHPYATSFHDNASASELGGGGESGNRDQLMALLGEEDPDEGEILKYLTGKDGDGNVIGDGHNKGLIDESAVEYVPEGLQGDYQKYQFKTIFTLLKTGGLDSEKAMGIASKAAGFPESDTSGFLSGKKRSRDTLYSETPGETPDPETEREIKKPRTE